MAQNELPLRRPRIVLITGVPGSGKTTLGTRISRALQIPFIARDDVRRGLYFTTGGWSSCPGPAPSRSESVETFLRLAEATAALDISFVAEYVLGRGRTDEFERLEAVGDCGVIMTECAQALDRFEARHRDDRLLNREPVLDALGYETIETHTADALDRMRSVAADMRTDFDVPSMVVRTEGDCEPDLSMVLDFVTHTLP